MRYSIYFPLVCRGHITSCTLFGFNVYITSAGITLFGLFMKVFLGPKVTDWQRLRYPAFLIVWSVKLV